MVHAYRLVYLPTPSAPDPLWEWQQPWIDHLLWHVRTFSRQVELWWFPSGDALDRANTRLWAMTYAPRLQYEPWPTWQAWLAEYRELLVSMRAVYEAHHGQGGPR